MTSTTAEKTTTYLALRWSTSRGRDTYGYNIVTLTDTATDQRFRTMGGGYDMIGTVLGDWLTEHYGPQLARLDAEEFYGLKHTPKMTKWYVDGACGLASVRKIAEAIGLELSATLDRKGNYTGFQVS